MLWGTKTCFVFLCPASFIHTTFIFIVFSFHICTNAHTLLRDRFIVPYPQRDGFVETFGELVVFLPIHLFRRPVLLWCMVYAAISSVSLSSLFFLISASDRCTKKSIPQQCLHLLLNCQMLQPKTIQDDFIWSADVITVVSFVYTCPKERVVCWPSPFLVCLLCQTCTLQSLPR